jgi:hypothetical protein
LDSIHQSDGVWEYFITFCVYHKGENWSAMSQFLLPDLYNTVFLEQTQFETYFQVKPP